MLISEEDAEAQILGKDHIRHDWRSQDFNPQNLVRGREEPERLSGWLCR